MIYGIMVMEPTIHLTLHIFVIIHSRAEFLQMTSRRDEKKKTLNL